MIEDERFMLRALELAEQGRFSTSPNPMVGCVIVRAGEILGEGFHLRAGLPHAEVEAIRACSSSIEGATVYVTLEPCAHFGRTPPCANALIEQRPKRVVIAAEDPFAEVNGRGIRALEHAGVEVTLGVLRDAARRQNERFFHNCEKSLPFVVLKAGMTLDAKLATVGRQSKWITSTAARERSLLLREEYDSILVGSGTVRDDDPQLTRRVGRNSSVTPWARVIIDGDGIVPRGARVLNDGQRTLLFTAAPEAYGETTAEVIGVSATDGRVELRSVLGDLFALGIRSVLVEGGSMIHSTLIAEELWQKMVLFVAPLVVGGATAPAIFASDGIADLTSAHRLRFDAVEKVGPDLMITAYPPER